MSDYDGRKGIELGGLGRFKVRLTLGIIFIISLFSLGTVEDDLAQIIYGFMLVGAIVLWIIIEILIVTVKLLKKR